MNHPKNGYKVYVNPLITFFVIVSQRSTQLVIVHCGPILLHAPQTRHLLRIEQLELSLGLARPLNDRLRHRGRRRPATAGQQVQEKLPQLKATSLIAIVARCCHY